MSIHATRLTEADVDQHIRDLAAEGTPEDLKTDAFWDRIKVFIASCGDPQDRMRLIPWWIKRKKEHTGR